MTYKYFGKTIKEKREQLKTTITELSKETGVSTKNIRKLEKGNISVNREDMLAVSKYLEIKNYEEMIDYIEMYKKSYNVFKLHHNNHATNIIMLFGIITILILSFWLYINRTQNYLLSGRSTNFSYNNLYFVKSWNRYCIAFGTISINNSSIDKADIKRVSLKYNDEIIVESSGFPTGIIIENKGYNELFTADIVKNIDDWYYEVEYTIDEEKNVIEKIYLDKNNF